ncbi:hypothetical protein QBC36DRAFT_385112 [Triangularia setosa]|uniref:Uncharacterized protein n=1 Tax=Triangularia setosa TaxID=2587417 RepID=A0AAN6WG23_9PEZI|nr:hypothetical protein QBC36DRAFT_385112 [Podospora setosa]
MDKRKPLRTRGRSKPGSDSNGNKHQPKRAQLTGENLALFDKMARKKTQYGVVESLSARAVSSTSSGFADQAHKNGILHPLHSKPPTNHDEVRERHARSCATASSLEFEYKRYANNVGKAPHEATMVFRFGATLLKEYDDEGYNRVFNQPFTGFPKEGLEEHEYAPFPVEEHVNGAVLHKDNPFPQHCHPWPGSHAEVTTFTTDGTNTNLYAHYAAAYQYASANGPRDQQDHAREQPYTLKERLKEHWKQSHNCNSIAQDVQLPVINSIFEETNEDKDEAGYEIVEKPCSSLRQHQAPPLIGVTPTCQ